LTSLLETFCGPPLGQLWPPLTNVHAKFNNLSVFLRLQSWTNKQLDENPFTNIIFLCMAIVIQLILPEINLLFIYHQMSWRCSIVRGPGSPIEWSLIQIRSFVLIWRFSFVLSWRVSFVLTRKLILESIQVM
jgi:hypothetical protein